MLRMSLIALVASLPTLALAQAPKPAKLDPTAELFKPTAKLQTFQITLDEANVRSIRRDPRKYVQGQIEVGTSTFYNVALHLKGAAGSSRGWDDKPALTLNADKFVLDQNVFGLDKFHLNNSVQDGSYMNELTCGLLAKSMGLPTARATHALVELNGRKVGLYVLKEGYDKVFLKHNFPGASSGNLYDGGFLQDVDQALQLDEGTPNDRADLKALAKACRISDAKQRYEAVEKLVNVDLFVKNAALQIVGCDWDGYMRNRNNYRVYFPPKGGKAVFIPHGMDQMFGSPNETLWPGWGGMVARAILEYSEGKKLAIAALKEISEKHLTPEFLKQLDEWSTRTRDGLKEVNKDWAKSFENEAKNQRERVRQRMEYLKKELPKLK